jgi:hypothetical protein
MPAAYSFLALGKPDWRSIVSNAGGQGCSYHVMSPLHIRPERRVVPRERACGGFLRRARGSAAARCESSKSYRRPVGGRHALRRKSFMSRIKSDSVTPGLSNDPTFMGGLLCFQKILPLKVLENVFPVGYIVAAQGGRHLSRVCDCSGRHPGVHLTLPSSIPDLNKPSPGLSGDDAINAFMHAY